MSMFVLRKFSGSVEGWHGLVAGKASNQSINYYYFHLTRGWEWDITNIQFTMLFGSGGLIKGWLFLVVWPEISKAKCQRHLVYKTIFIYIYSSILFV